MFRAEQSIFGPKSRKALGRPISCNHRKPEGFDEKMRIWAVLKVKIEDAPVVFKDFVRFCCFLEKMPEYRVFSKAELEDAPVTLTQDYRCVFITCTVKQIFEKKVMECTRLSSGTVDFEA